MKLRWLTVYDIDGKDAHKDLQYWDDTDKMWIDINEFRCSFKEESFYITDPNRY